MFKPTLEQQKTIDMARLGQTMKIIAFAGAGKTSTLYLVAQALKEQGKKGIYLAFNKSIATEAQTKMPDNVTAKTFHALAYGSTPRSITSRLSWNESPKDFIDRHGIQDLPNILFRVPSDTPTGFKSVQRRIAAYRLRFLILESIKTFCRSSSNTFNLDMILTTIKTHEPFISEPHKIAVGRVLFPVTAKVMSDYFSVEGELPLNNLHDVYLKHWAMSKPVINADFVMFDEAQDADPIMRQILEEQNIQVIYVGDPYQQIYSWRGAENAMGKIEADSAYLTQSFRFGSELAQTAQIILDYLDAPLAIQGTPTKTTNVDFDTPGNRAKTNAYICRTNAGIIEAAFWHIKQGKRFAVIGLNFKEFVEIIKAFDELEEKHKTNHPLLKDFANISDLDMFLDATKGEMQITPYRNLHRQFKSEVILTMLDDLKNTKIDENTVVGVTAHSAKGLEYDSICLGQDFIKMFFEESKNKTLTPKIEINPEEFRLLYVAITRAKKCAYLHNVRPIFDGMSVFKRIKMGLATKDTYKPVKSIKTTNTHAVTSQSEQTNQLGDDVTLF